MKKIFIIPTVLFCLIMVSFSIYYKRTETVLVGGELIAFEVEGPKKTDKSGEYIETSLKKMGILTYINPETNQFVALGHSITNSKEWTEIEGKCYGVQFITNNSNLQEAYLDEENPIGYVYYDNYSGVYGKINDISQKQYKAVETANRYDIKKGKANILISLDNEKIESYDVEILAINYMSSNKNIRIKVTDERLINETGGIVQGMSGTPVMQNGKLVGAINCVSVNNPQDGYAIFIDKLI